jgi:hypothetical protein
MSPEMRRRSVKVWRYMSFGRFVWMLKRKALWMSRVDQLDDAWEGVLGAGKGPVERRIFVNCWTAQNSESHAMWSIYCTSKEGVAIQTTLSKLRRSVGQFSVLPVQYVDPGSMRGEKVTALELAVRKRKPFQYEKELRIVHVPPDKPQRAPLLPPVEDDEDDDEPGGILLVTELYGFPLTWEPERWLEAVLIHPGADYTFRYALEAVVEALAPSLRERIRMSGMAKRPPKLSMKG